MSEIFIILLAISIGVLAYLTRTDFERMTEFVNRLLKIAEEQDKQIKYLQTEINNLNERKRK
ncbi:MAG: hypothetical protein IPN57_09890 [Ignavibacteria bacterium]|nr:hypothetical protein [Ignavibacteria bacterium]